MSTNWDPPIKGKTATHATRLAKEVARRCSVQAAIDKALADEQKNSPATVIRWNTPSAAGGDAGIALLCAFMHACFSEEGWDTAMHGYLAAAVKGYNHTAPNLSLYNGAAGLALTAFVADSYSQRYGALRQDFDRYLAENTPRFIKYADRHLGLYTSDFDAISGVVGITAYLTVIGQTTASAALRGAADGALAYLVSLTKPDANNGLYCFIANNHIPIPERKQLYIKGYADTGLAHGAAGVVAALALAILGGWSVPGIEEGLEAIAEWLVQQQMRDAYGINWPTFLEPSMKNMHVSRAAWCYGVPGIARSLYLAGSALHSVRLQEIAIAALDDLIDRPREIWRAVSPNICHGLGGILLIALRTFQDTGAQHLQVFCEHLVNEIISLYDPDTLFGFQDLNTQGRWYDNPRLLEGAPGVALALLAATQPVTPQWDRLFLLS